MMARRYRRRERFAAPPPTIVAPPASDAGGTGVIGGRAFLDSNDDGRPDDDDDATMSAMPTMEVWLRSCDGGGLASEGEDLAACSTPSNGVFRFVGLAAGEYYLFAEPPEGYRFSSVHDDVIFPGDGGDGLSSLVEINTIDPVERRTGCIALDEGGRTMDWSFGLHRIPTTGPSPPVDADNIEGGSMQQQPSHRPSASVPSSSESASEGSSAYETLTEKPSSQPSLHPPDLQSSTEQPHNIHTTTDNNQHPTSSSALPNNPLSGKIENDQIDEDESIVDSKVAMGIIIGVAISLSAVASILLGVAYRRKKRRRRRDRRGGSGGNGGSCDPNNNSLSIGELPIIDRQKTTTLSTSSSSRNLKVYRDGDGGVIYHRELSASPNGDDGNENDDSYASATAAAGSTYSAEKQVSPSSPEDGKARSYHTPAADYVDRLLRRTRSQGEEGDANPFEDQLALRQSTSDEPATQPTSTERSLSRSVPEPLRKGSDNAWVGPYAGGAIPPPPPRPRSTRNRESPKRDGQVEGTIPPPPPRTRSTRNHESPRSGGQVGALLGWNDPTPKRLFSENHDGSSDSRIQLNQRGGSSLSEMTPQRSTEFFPPPLPLSNTVPDDISTNSSAGKDKTRHLLQLESELKRLSINIEANPETTIAWLLLRTRLELAAVDFFLLKEATTNNTPIGTYRRDWADDSETPAPSSSQERSKHEFFRLQHEVASLRAAYMKHERGQIDAGNRPGMKRSASESDFVVESHGMETMLGVSGHSIPGRLSQSARSINAQSPPPPRIFSTPTTAVREEVLSPISPLSPGEAEWENIDSLETELDTLSEAIQAYPKNSQSWLLLNTHILEARQELEAFREDATTHIIAPAGNLGMVLDKSPLNNGPVTILSLHQLSPLRKQVEPGDRIIAINGEDVQRLSAVEVSQMLCDKVDSSREISVMKLSSSQGQLPEEYLAD